MPFVGSFGQAPVQTPKASSADHAGSHKTPGDGAAAPDPSYSQSLARLEEQWEALGHLPALKGASRSLVLRSPDGSLLRAFDGERRLVPASTAKVLVTAAALDLLGPRHRFRTALVGRGYLDQKGVWQGDLVLLGGGDPSLGSGREGCLDADAQLAEWVQAVRAAGIRRIRGRLIGDGLLWGEPEAPGAWAWDDLGNHFAPSLDALIFDENRFYSHFRTPLAAGAPAELLGTEPDLPHAEIRHRVRSGAPGSGDQAYAYSIPGGSAVLWKGQLPPGRKRFTVKGAWPDPSLAAATRLEQALEKAGIAVDGEAASAWVLLPGYAATNSGQTTDTLWTAASPTLHRLVQWTNRESLNGYAEALLRALGQQGQGPGNGDRPLEKKGASALPGKAPAGSVEAGLEILQQWLQEQAREACRGQVGCSTDAWSLNDGSGLARRNRLDAQSFSALLAHWTAAPWFESFFLSLPRSGGLGTLARVAPEAPGRLAAKSGTIGGVRCYAGYWQGRSGNWYPLVLLLNHADASGSAMRLALDPVLQALLPLP
jgi:D-alanyl-D-alanine carboxypeptidase/D-alanyl-D-alanine-endopeptidase (penicillin-binding protein 4)